MKKQWPKPQITLIIALPFIGFWNHSFAGCCRDIFCCCCPATCCSADNTVTQLAPTKTSQQTQGIVVEAASRQYAPPPAQEMTDLSTTDVKGLVIAELNNSLFFTCSHPSIKLDNQNATLPLKTLNNEIIKKWFAEDCSNPMLTKLINFTIKYIDQHEKSDEKLATASTTAASTTMATAENKTAIKKPKLAIFDIDNTLLSSYQGYLEIAQARNRLTEAQKSQILFSNCTDITPVHQLYTYFQKKGYYIAIVSARSEPAREFTKFQLRSNGYALPENNLFLREIKKHEIKQADIIDAAIFKAHIRAGLAKIYDIVAVVDDIYENLSDTDVGRYNIWIPNVLGWREDDTRFYAHLQSHSIFGKEPRI
jgi:predicted secreted acid phosphatase